MRTKRRLVQTAILAAVSFGAAAQDGSDSPPSQPGSLIANAYSSSSGGIRWERSRDDAGFVPGYEVRRDGVVLGVFDALSYVDRGLDEGTAYEFEVVAIDTSGQRSATSRVTLLTEGVGPDSGGGDGDVPASPSGLRAVAYSQRDGEIFWDRTDTFGLVYEVSRDGEVVTTTNGTSHYTSGLSSRTSYEFEVVAIDRSGNRSSPSNVALVTEGEPVAMDYASVAVDFSRSRGEYLHTERFNTWDNGDPEPELREEDIAFLTDQGLRADIVRVGIRIDTDICDIQAQACDFSEVDWLFDVSTLTEAMVVHLTPEGLFEPDREPADLKPLLTLAIGELKAQIPNVAYIEAFNEPDWVNHVSQILAGEEPEVQPEELYQWYVPFYQAVNSVNVDLDADDRLKVGGPTLMSFDHEGWIPSFLDGFAADTSPDKRLDFVSWHGYGYFDESADYRAYVFFKDDPRLVADQRERLDTMLTERGMGTDIPALVTETGVYPGPSSDEPDPSKGDWVRQGPGLASLHYWYAEQPNIYPFHWTVRHEAQGRKDQLVTLRNEDQTSPTETFTPYGNSLLMQSMMRDERVVAESDALVEGKGVYAIATKGESGFSIMIWNYQGIDEKPYRVTLDLGDLPVSSQVSTAVREQFRIDDDTSNYWTDADNANLQRVSQEEMSLSDMRRMTIDLPPNAMHLVTIDVEGDPED